MEIKLLDTHELEALSKSFDFAHMAESIVTTKDLRPIDHAIHLLENALTNHGNSFPCFVHSGSIQHAPVPEGVRKYYPEHKHNGWMETTLIHVRGVLAGNGLAIAFADIRKPDAPEINGRRCIWGLDAKSGKLVFHRSLPMEAVLATTCAMLFLFSSYEALAIDKESKNAENSPPSRRL